MNAASGLETIEAAKVHQPPVVEPTKESFEAAVRDDGFEIPTEEEMKTLRRVSGKIPWSAYTIAFVEFCERFSYYGTTAVCEFPCSGAMIYATDNVLVVNFIQQPLPEGSTTGAGKDFAISGALGMGQRASTGLTTL